MKRYKTADEFYANQDIWRDELERLRKIVSQTELKEEVKWGGPVYTLAGKNVVGIGGFKSYFGLWFYQGVFMKDKAGVLVNAQEGKTKALRQWRMNSREDIDEELITNYLEEAIANQKAGKEVKPEKKPLVIPPELKAAFSVDLDLRDAFEGMTLGKKREYADYVSDAKQDATKQSRLGKIIPMIKSGVGLNDKYK